jgi:hypothetical protein
MTIHEIDKEMMVEKIKAKVLRQSNDARHAEALEQGLSVSVSSKVLLDQSDSDRIAKEGQNAVDEIAQRITTETGEDPGIVLSYVSPNHDMQDRAWLGI